MCDFTPRTILRVRRHLVRCSHPERVYAYVWTGFAGSKSPTETQVDSTDINVFLAASLPFIPGQE